MLATEPYLAIVWDEGYTLGREERLREWFHALADPAALRGALASSGRGTRPAGPAAAHTAGRDPA